MYMYVSMIVLCISVYFLIECITVKYALINIRVAQKVR